MRTISILSILSILSIIPVSYAQAPVLSLPPDMGITCSAAYLETLTATCLVQIPKDTIGSKLHFQFPKTHVTSIQDVRRSTLIPNSILALRLEAQSALTEVDLYVDAAELTLQGLSKAPYTLALFDLTLNSTLPLDFPLEIPVKLMKDSELHTVESYSKPDAEISPPDHVPFSVTIAKGAFEVPSVDPIPPTQRTVSSSFSFQPTISTFKGAAQYCFDDPEFAMTPEEWSIICEAQSRGIISGNQRDNGTFFFPNQPINRAEAMKIVTLGILKSLDKLDQKQFDDEQARLERSYRNSLSTILYPDVGYDAPNQPFWFAVYVSIATAERIIGGYPDGTFRPVNEINNAESYRVIVETGARASSDINRQLSNAKTRTAGDDWFIKYAQTLSDYDIPYSRRFGELTTRKEFMILVMELLRAVGL